MALYLIETAAGLAIVRGRNGRAALARLGLGDSADGPRPVRLDPPDAPDGVVALRGLRESPEIAAAAPAPAAPARIDVTTVDTPPGRRRLLDPETGEVEEVDAAPEEDC